MLAKQCNRNVLEIKKMFIKIRKGFEVVTMKALIGTLVLMNNGSIEDNYIITPNGTQIECTYDLNK